jgi:nicotinamidase-related amidase
MLKTESSALLLIDFQGRLMPAIAESESVLENATKLAKAARLMHVPIAATVQNPSGLGPLVDCLEPYPLSTLSKMSFDATRATDFANILPPDRKTMIVAGCEAHVCVLQTCLGMIEMGFEVVVVADAVGSRRLESRRAAIDRLTQHDVEIVTTEMVLFEWLENAAHPAFKDVLSLLK